MMIKKILAVLATALCLVSAMAGEKKVVWENPHVVRNAAGYSVLTLKKVVFTETETVLHFHAKYPPKYWIRFDEKKVLRDENGKTYPILNGKAVEADETDLEVGKEFWMPESGEAEIALHFAPLPIGTKVFDMAVGDENDFKLWSISDSKGKYKPVLPEEWKKVQYAKNEMLPDAKLKEGVAKLRLQILGYKPEMKFTLYVIGYLKMYDEEQMVRTFPVDDSGTVTVEIPALLAMQVCAGIANVDMAYIMLAPNETVEMLIDLNAPNGKQIVAFKGYMARTNMDRYLSRHVVEDRDLKKKMYEGLSVCNTPEERIGFLDKWLAEKKKEVNAMKVTDGAKAMLRMEAEDIYINWRREWAVFYTDAEIQAGVRTYTTDEEQKQWREEQQWREENAKLMPEEWVIDKEKDYFEVLGELYSPCMKKFWEAFDDSYDRNGNIVQYIRDLKQAYWMIATENPEVMNILDQMESEDCKNVVREHYAELQKKVEEGASSNHIHYQELDDVAPENILDAILERHSGKAVVIDMWATWCGPCRAGHKDMAPMKEDMKNEPVDFVYLASPSSPQDTWMVMAADIPGEHYYLTEEQTRYLLVHYKSNGFPTYAIYNKDKQQTYTSVGYPGLNKMREEIEKAMK